MLLRRLRRSGEFDISTDTWEVMSEQEQRDWLKTRLVGLAYHAGRAQRFTEKALLFLVVGVALGAFVMYGYLSGREARRQALEDVVCLILKNTQPTTQFHVDLAKKYPHCPSFTPFPASLAPSPQPSATPSEPRSRHNRPSATLTPQTSTVVLPGGRTTVVVHTPHPVMRTTTKTVTKPVRTPTPSRSPGCPLPTIILPGLITVPPVC